MGRVLEFNVHFFCMHNNRTEDPLQVTTMDRTIANIHYSEKGIHDQCSTPHYYSKPWEHIPILLHQYLNIALNDTKS